MEVTSDEHNHDTIKTDALGLGLTMKVEGNRIPLLF